MGSRKLLREGVLSKAKSGRKIRVFLCSDLIVLTDELAKTLYRMVCTFLIVLRPGVKLNSCVAANSPCGS